MTSIPGTKLCLAALAAWFAAGAQAQGFTPPALSAEPGFTIEVSCGPRPRPVDEPAPAVIMLTRDMLTRQPGEPYPSARQLLAGLPAAPWSARLARVGRHLDWGRVERALDEWTDFRRAYPDAQVPEALQARLDELARD